ncbi:MAG: hypothetical protein WD066_01810 [Planctomycetaceae bacterium]
MTIAIVLIGVFIAAVGLLGALFPLGLIRFAEIVWRAPRILFVGAAIRLAIGALLIVAAEQSRFPWTFRVLGAITIAAGLALPVVGFHRLRRFIDWWARRPYWMIRGWALLAVAFGAFLIYAILP